MYRYYAEFLDADCAVRLQRQLAADVAWQRETLRLFGRRVRVPRLLAWFGDPGLNYRYSGADHVCNGWLPALAALRDRLALDHNLHTNLVLLNRYPDGAHYMGWHADDERGLGDRIASVSLGATRRFLLREPGSSKSHRLDLEPGSLLLMDGTVRHALPRTQRAVGERISLTFRHIGGDLR